MLIALLREYLRPHRRVLALVLGLQFGQTVASLYLPTLNADIIDRGVVLGDTGHIVRTGGLMLAVSVLQLAGQAVAVYYATWLAMRLGSDLRSALFRRVQSFSAREVGAFGTSSLVNRVTNDVQQIQTLMNFTLTMAVLAPVVCLGSLTLALLQDVRLATVLLVALPLLTGTIALVLTRSKPLFRLVQTRLDGINRVLREQITGMRVIRAFVREDRERERFATTNDELRDVSTRAGQLMAALFPVVQLAVNVSSVAVLWFGGHGINSGALQVGELTAFLNYLLLMMMSVLLATFVFMMLPRAEVSAERLQEVLRTAPGLTPPADPARLAAHHGRLALRDVSLLHPGAQDPVLRHVDVVGEPSTVTAIVGSTGSGKTTLLHLVPRLMDPTGGIVTIDGVDVRDLDRATLAGLVGLVPQRPYLFSGTVATNLRFGNPDATDDELWHALDVAQSADFVRGLDGGLDAPISQAGTNVSGGQRQRLAIARALVLRPAIYLFDDSFSALDNATDAALRAALAAETADATVVIVAARISTIRDADRIVVLDEGRVVGTGTHDELLATNETYRELVGSQLSDREVTA